MIESLPAFQKAVTNHASYRLRANIQFNAITLIMNELKNDNSSVILVIDHTQKSSPRDIKSLKWNTTVRKE